MSRKTRIGMSIDKRTRDYIDAVQQETPPPPSPELNALQKEVSTLTLQLHGLKAEVADLRNLLTELRYEDRLTLTRSRLIRAINALEVPE